MCVCVLRDENVSIYKKKKSLQPIRTANTRCLNLDVSIKRAEKASSVRVGFLGCLEKRMTVM